MLKMQLLILTVILLILISIIVILHSIPIVIKSFEKSKKLPKILFKILNKK